MEMDWGTAIVGLIMLLICIVPFVIMYYNRKKKENKMLQSLNEIAKPHNCKISQHEFCGDYVMGIDESRNFVFFFKQKKEEAISQFVDLSEIQICQVVKKAISTYSTQRLELVFLPTNKSKTETKFELYDEEVNTQLSGELQFVDKWAKQINDRLKNKK
ncbi:MAG: hypothetical protein WC319_06685 [Candidatus Paceibacterota bacterium]|jgi:hypothetical protein